MTRKHRTDAETTRLIDDLLTQAGMIMEDASVTALLRDSLGANLHNRIDELENSAESITAIVRAARVLLDG